MTDKTVYRYINGLWPKAMLAPTEREAISGVKALWRHATGKPLKLDIEITSGNRYTWTAYSAKRDRHVLRVNPEGHHFGGWRDIVHDLSHLILQRGWERPDLKVRRRFPRKPHDSGQAYLERDLVEYALKRGMPEGKHVRAVKPKPDRKRDVVVERFKRMIERREKWEAKSRRAEKALAKVEREIADYERRHGERLPVRPERASSAGPYGPFKL